MSTDDQIPQALAPTRHLDRMTIDRWAETHIGSHVLGLANGETMPCGAGHHGDNGCYEGPETIELIAYRDGGWFARILDIETVDSIRRDAR